MAIMVIKLLCVFCSIILIFLIIRDNIRAKKEREKEEERLSELKKYYESLYENKEDL